MPLTWTKQLGAPASGISAVQGIAASNAGSIVQYFTDGSGNIQIYRSTDGGISWTNTGTFSIASNGAPESLTCDGTIFLLDCNSNHFLRSHDDGQTWQSIFHAAGVGGCITMAFDGTGNWWGLTSVGNQVRSTDGGLTWSSTSGTFYNGAQMLWDGTQLLMLNVTVADLYSSPAVISFSATATTDGLGAVGLLNQLLFANGVYLACLTSNGYYHSSVAPSGWGALTAHGITGLTVAAGIVALGGGGWFTAADQHNHISSSQDAATWASDTLSYSPTDNPVCGCYVPVHNLFVFGGGLGTIVTSNTLGGSSTVPNVIGDTLATATTAINAAGLVVGTVTTVPSSTVPSGDIIAQTPAAGTIVATGSAVNLTESTGPAMATVPNIVGITKSAAEAALLAAGFLPGVESGDFSSIVPLNIVISQNPAAGTSQIVGSNVSFHYSLGIPPITVPDVVGEPLLTAENTIISATLAVGIITAQEQLDVPVGTILAQSPAAGTLVPPGTQIAMTVAAFANAFDVDATVISQYANSPTLMRLVENMGQYLDQSVNFVNFFSFVWNVDTAVGFGLDIWGKIVGVSRLLHIGSNTATFGFANSDSPPDWQPFGSGTFFNGGTGTAYLLPDDAFRTLILTKALANITATNSKSLNQLLRNLFPGRGVCFVRDNLDMTMTFVFRFPLTSIEFAILTQSGVLPHPAGVGFNVIVIPPARFGFREAGPSSLPFNFGVFYLPP